MRVNIVGPFDPVTWEPTRRTIVGRVVREARAHLWATSMGDDGQTRRHYRVELRRPITVCVRSRGRLAARDTATVDARDPRAAERAALEGAR